MSSQYRSVRHKPQPSDTLWLFRPTALYATQRRDSHACPLSPEQEPTDLYAAAHLVERLLSGPGLPIKRPEHRERLSLTVWRHVFNVPFCWVFSFSGTLKTCRHTIQGLSLNRTMLRLHGTVALRRRQWRRQWHAWRCLNGRRRRRFLASQFARQRERRRRWNILRWMLQIVARRQSHARHPRLAPAQRHQCETQTSQTKPWPAAYRFHEDGTPSCGPFARMDRGKASGARSCLLYRMETNSEFTGFAERIDQYKHIGTHIDTRKPGRKRVGTRHGGCDLFGSRENRRGQQSTA